MRKDKKTWRYGKPHKGQSSEKVPHYCKRANEWRCMVDYPWAERNYEERGDIEYVMGEFSQYGEVYHFHYADSSQINGQQDHEHDFAGVLWTLIRWPEQFSVARYEEDYSSQEIALIKAVRERLLAMGKKNER